MEDGLPPGFVTADLAVVAFDGTAREQALDLSLADARFAPDVLEAAARRAVAAWAEAVDGDDAALEAVATPEAVSELLYGGDASRKTRVVVRGPRVRQIRIVAVDVEQEPATMTIEVEVGGRRYVEDRDTAAVLAGSKDRATVRRERWMLSLRGNSDDTVASGLGPDAGGAKVSRSDGPLRNAVMGNQRGNSAFDALEPPHRYVARASLALCPSCARDALPQGLSDQAP